MTEAVIFDLDGTLCDTSGIVHLVQGDDKDYHAFHAASADCPANQEVVAAAREQAAKGRSVLVVTSREFIWRDVSLDWLVEHQVPYDGLYMRIVGDYRKDVVIKQEILEQITADGFGVVAAWDDKEAVVDLWRENGIEVHVVPTP